MYFTLMYLRELLGEEIMLVLSLASKERKSCDKIASTFDEYLVLFRNTYKTHIFLLYQRKISMWGKKKNLLKLCTSSDNTDLIARFYAKIIQNHLAAQGIAMYQRSCSVA